MHPPIGPKPRRRWLWIVLAVLLTPIVVLAGAAINYLTLDGDARVLRRHVMHAAGGEWDTTVQFSIGGPTFSVLRAGFAVVNSEKTFEAQKALRAVRSASVGVYQLRSSGALHSDVGMLRAADELMERRGWDRAIGVIDDSSTVMIFVPQNQSGRPRVCLAVLDGEELVVVSAVLDARALGDLIRLPKNGKWREALPVSF